MKKTNIRVRRNGGSKPASPQVPNKPEHSRARSNKSGPRFEGIVQDIIKYEAMESGGIGRISFSPVPGRTMEIAFSPADLPEGRDRYLRIGGRVSFRLAKNEQGSIALDLRAITLAPELPVDGWEPLTVEFIKASIELHETKHGDSLCRDKSGRLFVARKIRNASKRVLGTEYREVSFAQACDWLVNQGHEMIPEVFLERHGILEQARLVRRDEKVTALRVDDSIDSAFALIELLEHRCTDPDLGSLPEYREQAFINGIINLTSMVQNDLLAFKEDYLAAMKAGAQ